MAFHDRELDITKTIKIIESLKAQLLSNVSQFFSSMVDGNKNKTSDHADILADIVILTYLLAKKLGISYDALDVKILNKLKLGLLEKNNTDEWLVDLTSLSRHIDKTRDLDRR